MGAFVAVYNSLGLHLTAPPYLLPAWSASMLLLAPLAGTISSPWAGLLATRHGRYRILTGSVFVAALGIAVMLVPVLLVMVLGLLTFTAGFSEHKR